MDIERLIEQLRDKGCEDCPHRDTCRDDDTAECVIRLNAATALSTLQAENEKLRTELYSLRPGFQNQKALIKQLRAKLEQVKRERDDLIEDFVDYVTGGVPNPAIFCKNRCDKCTDMRGWCTGKECKGFYPSGASGQKED